MWDGEAGYVRLGFRPQPLPLTRAPVPSFRIPKGRWGGDWPNSVCSWAQFSCALALGAAREGGPGEFDLL